MGCFTLPACRPPVAHVRPFPATQFWRGKLGSVRNVNARAFEPLTWGKELECRRQLEDNGKSDEFQWRCSLAPRGKIDCLSKLADAVVPLVTGARRDEATISFRTAIEDIMAVTDDTILPADYHSALLAGTNFCLEMLRHLRR